MNDRLLIGGDYEISSIETNDFNSLDEILNNKGTWTLNGRSAFYLILNDLKSKGIKHVHLPSFICDTLLQAVAYSGLSYSFYPINALDLSAYPDPPTNSGVLLIHYFGHLNKSTEKIRDQIDKDFLIEDATHTFLNTNFFQNINDRVIFFSVRKYCASPLGAWSSINSKLESASREINEIEQKSLLARQAKWSYLNSKDKIDQKKENYYLKLFLEVEEFFNSKIHPFKIPDSANKILSGINWKEIIKKRKKNWIVIHSLLGELCNPIYDKLDDDSVPLGYVINLKNRDYIKKKLAEKRIFAPIHWPLPSEVNEKYFPDSKKLSQSILTLPIDHRYSSNDMNYIANTIKDLI
jgi:hypothetical protein